MISIVSALFFALIATVLSIPQQGSGESFSGDGTFYYPQGGYGSCGTQLQNTDMICALSATTLQSVPCGSCLLVSGPKGSVKVKVMDKCGGCKPGDVDLSYSAFLQIGDEAAGRIHVSSQVVSC